MIPALARHTGLHVATAFVLMGSWALFANWEHPMPKPLIAAVVQGALSGAITFGLKRCLDALRARMRGATGAWLPPLLTLSVSLTVLITAHLLASTPDVAQTIAVPFSVASLYAVAYNFLNWRNERQG